MMQFVGSCGLKEIIGFSVTSLEVMMSYTLLLTHTLLFG